MKSLLCLLCLGCASVPQSIETRPHVVVDPALSSFLAGWHNRQVGHTELPDEEAVLCLLGRVSHDTIYVEGFAAPRIYSANDTSVAFGSCDHPDAIGTVHTHHARERFGDGCFFSAPDTKAFLDARREILQAVTCGTERIGLLTRAKKGYSER